MFSPVTDTQTYRYVETVLTVNWHHALKFRMDVEICTCAGRNPDKNSSEHTWASLARPAKHSPTPGTMKPIHPKHETRLLELWVAHLWAMNRYFIQSSQTATPPLTAAPSYPHQNERKPRTHLLTSKGMVAARFYRRTSGQSYNQRGTIQLSSMLPVVRRYRADVSLGRFAKDDWLRATSCSLWFFFRRNRRTR